MLATREISEQEIAELEAKGKLIKGRREYRRLKSVLLRARDKKTAQEIGQQLGIHPRTVEKHHARYFKEGMATFDILKTGPKGPRFLSVQTEQNWLKAQEQKAAQGELLTALQMKESYEQLASRSVTLETIYKALHRNGWSKKQPRPRHPKGNEEAKTLFKKT